MSKSSEDTIQNFEALYYSLKDEFDQMQNDNNEIFREYESTIQLLTESISQLQNQQSIMNKKLTQIEKEKQSLLNKNFDKIIDIQDLNKKNEKLNQEIKTIKEDKKMKDTKIVILENDTEHFQQLIRQSEAIIEELNIKLEEALEDNITIQTDFEIYKQIMGEQLMRKDEELKDIKNDMFSKNLIIQKLKKMKENIANITTPIKEKLLSSYKLNKTKDEINSSSTHGKDTNNEKTKLFNNMLLNSLLKSSTSSSYHPKTKIKNRQTLSLSAFSLKLNDIKFSQHKDKYICHQLNSASFKHYHNNNSIRTPPSNKMNYINSYNSGNTHKKIYEEIKEYKKINKFVICDVNEKIDKEKNSDLNDFKKEENNYTASSRKKLVEDDVTAHNYRNVNIAPFEDAFLKQILNSKKTDYNFEKLVYSSYPERKKNVSRLQEGVQKMKNLAKRINKCNIFANISLKNVLMNVCKCSSKFFLN